MKSYWKMQIIDPDLKMATCTFYFDLATSFATFERRTNIIQIDRTNHNTFDEGEHNKHSESDGVYKVRNYLVNCASGQGNSNSSYRYPFCSACEGKAFSRIYPTMTLVTSAKHVKRPKATR